MNRRTSTRRRWAAAAAGLAVVLTGAVAPTASAAPEPRPDAAILHADDAAAVKDSYIVVLKGPELGAAAVRDRAANLATAYQGKVRRTWSTALDGFSVELTRAQAEKLAADPAVDFVEQNRTVSLATTQAPTPSWGLDRIDQRSLPATGSYAYPNTGSGVTVYVVDTGILTTHADFGGRAVHGYDFVDNDADATDCNGHGTHVAGTVGGSTYGVAKGTRLVGVRVLDCAGEGTYEGVVSGIDWVTADHDAGERAVANMSLGGDADAAVDAAVAASIADGVTFAVAAGNETVDACTVSPARTPDAITVGATTSTDARASYSNYGSCLDIFAPGSSITSAWYTSTSATNTISGTSMASPHVAGAAALVLNAHPTYTPAQVRTQLVGDATPGVVTGAGTGSPNRLLYVGAITPPAQDFTLALSAAVGSVSPGTSVTTTVTTATTVGTPQSVALSATGLPAGVTATFSPATVTSGGSSTLTLRAASTAAPGFATVTVAAVGTATTHTTAYSLATSSAPGCTKTNGTDLAVPDSTTIESAVTLSGCAGTRSTAVVDVDITHAWRGDLVVSLVAPDGSVYALLNRSGGSADDVDRTFTVTLQNETANGTWKLRVKDAAPGDAGTLTGWSISL